MPPASGAASTSDAAEGAPSQPPTPVNFPGMHYSPPTVPSGPSPHAAPQTVLPSAGNADVIGEITAADELEDVIVEGDGRPVEAAAPSAAESAAANC